MKKEKLILVTNDDGITSKGITVLQKVMQKFGKVVVIAPDSAMSGMGHAITINQPLRLFKDNHFNNGVESYSCSGTPVDCVKLGIYEILDGVPDLIVSGINHGSNAATNVLYSGTMSAAVEGAMENISSIGFSLCSYDPDANFDHAVEIVEKVVANVLDEGIGEGVCLNVNIPDVQNLKGLKVCRQAHAFWEDFFEKRMDPHNRPYYWLTGDFVEQTPAEDTDLFWLEKGYATVVPTQFDLTAYKVMTKLKQWEL